ERRSSELHLSWGHCDADLRQSVRPVPGSGGCDRATHERGARGLPAHQARRVAGGHRPRGPLASERRVELCQPSRTRRRWRTHGRAAVVPDAAGPCEVASRAWVSTGGVTTETAITDVAGIASRSPSYIVRQLYDMQQGTRQSDLMESVVANLTNEDMVV